MPSPIDPFVKADFEYLWKNGAPKNEVYVVLRKLLEGRLVQLLEDASRRVDAADTTIKVRHLTPSATRAGNLYFVSKVR
jgi:hypothetical protein